MAILQLTQRSGSPLTRSNAEGCQRALATSRKCPMLVELPHLLRVQQMPRRCVAVKAARNDKSGQSSSNDFNLAEYVEAKVEIGKVIAWHCFTFLSRSS